jgi:F0F1-type ATP synthase membrane subunit b/b'
MQAESIISGARADIEKEKLSMMNDIKSKVINLSLKLNEKLFTSEKANKDFMEKELNSINP